MSLKTCFKCGESKPRSEFYEHKEMRDGLMGKCKMCTKKDVRERILRKQRTDPQWVVAERKRCRLKERKRQDKIRRGEIPPSPQLPKCRDPRRKAANAALYHAVRSGQVTKHPCEVCGCVNAQGHHEDYDKALDVVWLCPRHHSDRHIHLRDCDTLGIAPTEIGAFMKTLQHQGVGPF